MNSKAEESRLENINLVDITSGQLPHTRAATRALLFYHKNLVLFKLHQT